MSYFELTKTNRLKKPSYLKEVRDEANDRINCFGQPLAHVGDYVFLSGRGISAGTVGKIVDIDVNFGVNMTAGGHQWTDHYALGTPATIELLDGKTNKTWLYYLTVIDYAAVQEVKDFYINDNRSERIKVSW